MEKEQQKEQQLADMKVVPMPANGDVELGGAGKHQHHEVRSSMQLEDGAPPDPNSTLTDVAHCQIVYSEVFYTVDVQEKDSKQTKPKDILKGVSGVIHPGKLTAVMGASGAGKTTFLNVLAGYSKGKARVRGTISVNGDVMEGDDMRSISGFVHQEDVILDTMTVREALLFAAHLKLPSSMPREEKVRRALDIADLLNLRKSLDNVVGSALIKGISGGEKRRLALGMEMITNPSILFLDEPTSGLDSFTAFKVSRILANVAHRYGRTIVCTIHQPSSEVFSAFDDLVVLAEGAVAYHGEVSGMVGYFAGLGYDCPTHFNPADFLFMSVLHATDGNEEEDYDFLSKAQETTQEARAKAREQEAARINSILQAWAESPANKSMVSGIKRQATLTHGVHESAIKEHASFGTQFMILAARAQRNAWRNQLIIKGKLAQTVFLSLIVGLIYLRLDNDQKGVQDRQGSLFFIIVQGLFGSVMGILTIFGGEKAVFQREHSSKMYGLPAYFISRWLVELPSHVLMPILSSVIIYWLVGYQNTAAKFWWFALIQILVDNCGVALGIFVSCLFNDIAVALSVMPMFLLPLMVFSGFFVNSDNLGWWFNWISYISPMKYGFVALVKNEFEGLELEKGNGGSDSPFGGQSGGKGYESGDEVIDIMGFDDLGSIEQNAGILFAITCGFLILAYFALWAAVRRMDK